MTAIWLFALLHAASFGQCAAPSLGTRALGDAAGTDASMMHLPRESHSPTVKERTAAVDNYRKSPNQGFKMTDEARGSYRRPTAEEAETATARSISYHKHHNKFLRTLATGNSSGQYSSLPINTPENEDVAAQWAQTGAARAKSIQAEVHPADLSPATPAPQKGKVYAATAQRAGLPHLPRAEPVFVKEFTGDDKVAMMPPITTPPNFDDCKEGPSYTEHAGMDPNPIMTDKEMVYPGRYGNVTEKETSMCEKKCSADMLKQKIGNRYVADKCLGYVETENSDLGAECWLIPQSKFPSGIVTLSEWAQGGPTGSTFIKSKAPFPNPNCGLPKSARTLLPASNFGPAVSSVIEISDTELQGLQARQKEFLDEQLSGLDTTKDAMVISERQDKASIWMKERKSKLIKQHNADLRTKAERTKKSQIVREINIKKVGERTKKAKVQQRERWAKSLAAAAKKAAQVKEEEYKASPEGQLRHATFLEKTKEIYAEQDADSQAYYIREAIRENDAREAEKKKVAQIQVNITDALDDIAEQNNASLAEKNTTGKFPNETIPVGSKLYKAMRFLQDNGVPFLD